VECNLSGYGQYAGTQTTFVRQGLDAAEERERNCPEDAFLGWGGAEGERVARHANGPSPRLSKRQTTRRVGT